MTSVANKNMSERNLRPIRSYVLRQGKLTSAQKKAIENYWHQYGIDFSEKILDLKSIFDRNVTVTLEIGFGNGDSLLEQACSRPDQDFIGIEVHSPGVGHLLHRIHQENIKNLRVIRHDAIEVLEKQIPETSLHCVQLLFPDPWHKKRHHKRRILQNSFIKSINKHLVVGGQFHMATDWENYAQHMLNEMDNAKGFKNNSGKGKYSNTKGARQQTKFERRGLKLGHGVWDLIYTKII
jgi:tRNA (guanine-N7-)-methyltransferase